MNIRRRHRLATMWAGLVTRHPGRVLAVATLVACFSVLVALRPVRLGPLTLGPLTFQSDRNALISQELEWSRRYIAWEKAFAGTTDIDVAVDVGLPRGAAEYEAHLTKAQRLVDELGPALAAQRDFVAHATWGYQARDFSPRAIRLAPMAEFDQRLTDVRQAKDLLQAQNLTALLNPFQPGRSTQSRAEEMRQLAAMLQGVRLALEDPARHPFDLEKILADPSDEDWEYLLSNNGRMLFIRVTPRLAGDAINALTPAVEAVRQIVARVAARHPGIEVGVTGGAALEADETRAAETDGIRTSILAFMLIFLVLALAYHSLRGPSLAMAALLFGVAWAYGFATLTVGHLQVISVVFTVPLLGLGVAYGVYLQSRFELVRHSHPDTLDGFEAALADALIVMGPGVILGSITTAIAFATTVFTDFRGVAEMGLIAGGGVLLCLGAMFTVLPALLRIFRPFHRHIRPMETRRFHFFEERWVMPFVRHPRLTLALGLLILALSGWAVMQMRFDYDLMKLQPRGAESVTWEERIVRDSGETMWTAVSLVGGPGVAEADALAQARRRKEAFARCPSVLNVGGVGLLFPEDDRLKCAKLQKLSEELSADLHVALADAPPASDNGASLLPRLAMIRQLLSLSTLFTSPTPADRAAMSELQKAIDQVQRQANGLSPEQRAERLARLDADYRQSRQRIARALQAMFDLSPLRPADMPAELMRAYQSSDGQLALEIYPRLSDGAPAAHSALEPAFLERFMSELKSVDPQITGIVPQIYHSGKLIKITYMMAGAWALAAVFVIVAAVFRSAGDALLTLVPVAIGFAATFAVLWLAGVGINPANIMVLPLMFGIGVDSGIQVIYRYRMDPTGQPPGLTGSTGKGVTVTNLATIAGFGVLMLAHHRGIISLGFVLAVGMTLTMLACWTIMPAWLRLRQG